MRKIVAVILNKDDDKLLQVDRETYPKHYEKKGHCTWTVEKMMEIDSGMNNLKITVNHNIDELIKRVERMDREMHQDRETLGRIARHEAAAVGSAATSSSGAASDETLTLKVRQEVEAQMEGMNSRVDIKINTMEGIANTLHRELDKTISAIEKLDNHRKQQAGQSETLRAKIQALERTVATKDSELLELQNRVRSNICHFWKALNRMKSVTRVLSHEVKVVQPYFIV